MLRPTAALLLLVVFGAVGFGWRTVVQVRRHGDTGWRFERTGPDRVVAPALVLAFVLLGAGPVIALIAGSSAEPWGIGALVGPGPWSVAAATVGAATAVAAGALTVVAQVQMGASWRIGVQAGEWTALVTSGLFSRVRNPIFAGMLAFAGGLALLVPNAPTLAGAVLAAVTIQAQVRLVEEPHLAAVHGESYPPVGRVDRAVRAPPRSAGAAASAPHVVVMCRWGTYSVRPGRGAPGRWSPWHCSPWSWPGAATIRAVTTPVVVARPAVPPTRRCSTAREPSRPRRRSSWSTTAVGS